MCVDLTPLASLHHVDKADRSAIAVRATNRVDAPVGLPGPTSLSVIGFPVSLYPSRQDGRSAGSRSLIVDPPYVAPSSHGIRVRVRVRVSSRVVSHRVSCRVVSRRVVSCRRTGAISPVGHDRVRHG